MAAPRFLLHHSNTSSDVYATKSLAFIVLAISKVTDYKYNLIDTIIIVIAKF